MLNEISYRRAAQMRVARWSVLEDLGAKLCFLNSCLYLCMLQVLQIYKNTIY